MSNFGRQIFLKRFNSISQEGKSVINSPTNKNSSQLNPNAQTKKIIEKLQKQAKHQKEKRQEIETKYESFKERFVNREREFYKILQKFNTHRQNDAKDDVYISEIYQKILCTFDAFNEKARQLLDDRYSELYRLMERRIDILMQKMDKQLSKYRKISQGERKQIQQAIREMGVIAAQTQNENIVFRKKNAQLQLKVQMLNEEKKILLEEIVGLKAQLLKLNQKQKITSKNKNHEDQQVWDNAESIKMDVIMKMNQQKNGRVLTARGSRYDDKVQTARMSNRYDNSTNLMNCKARDTMSTMKTVDFAKPQRHISSNQESIILHLKQCLQREKSKNFQLIKFSLQLQAKQQRIKQLITEQMNKYKTRSSQKSLVIKQIKLSQEFLRGTEQQKQTMSRSQQQNYDQNNEIADKKHMSILITEINKILHLPQTFNNDGKSIANFTNQLVTNYQQQNKKQSIQNNTTQLINNRHKNSNNHRRKLSTKRQQSQTPRSQISNKSILYNNSNKSSSNKNIKNTLFINYSPLDIDQISKSIQIK